MSDNMMLAVGYKSGIQCENAEPTEFEVSVLPNLPLIPKKEPHDWNTSFEDSGASDGAMSTLIPFTTPYKIRDPVIILERCDKVSEAINPTKTAKEKQPDRVVDLSQETLNAVEATPIDIGPGLNDSEGSPSDQPIESSKSYIKYQPTLKNGNSALPNFKFLVRDEQKLFSCLICGQQYTKCFELKQHCREVHNVQEAVRSHKKIVVSTLDQKNLVEPSQLATITANNNGSKDKDTTEERWTKVSQRTSLAPRSAEVDTAISNNSSVQSETQENGSTKTLEKQSNPYDPRKEKQDYGKVSGLQQNAVQTNEENSVTRCTLCRSTVKSLKSHLENYHKVHCSAFLMDQLTKSLSETVIRHSQKSSENENIKQILHQQNMHKTSLNNNNNDPAQNNSENPALKPIDDAEELAENKRKRNLNSSIDQPKKRRRYNGADVNKDESDYILFSPTIYKCDICLGKFNRIASFHRHTHTHYLRGETKENFHMFKCVYKNSPLHLRKTVWPHSITSQIVLRGAKEERSMKGSPTKNMNNVQRSYRETRNRRDRKHISLNGTATSREMKNNKTEKQEHNCACGRLFRSPYNLFVHKNHNKCGANEVPTSGIIEGNSDRDSGIGINLTIKKKNDSYEIVNSSNSDVNKTKDSEHSKDNDLSVCSPDANYKNHGNKIIVAHEPETPEPDKYSKDHVILKLKIAEEDAVINIEDDSDVESSCKSVEQPTSQDENIRKTEKAPDVADTKKEPNKQKKRNGSMNSETISLKSSDNVLKDQGNNTETICTCGRKCCNLWALHKHIVRVHPLMLRCGYCKTGLHSLKAYHTHQCTVKGKPFDMSLIYMSCDRCSTLLKNYKEYDEHNITVHPASIIEHKCYICFKSYTTPDMRLLHIARTHDGNDCSICGKSVRSYFRPVHEAYHHGFGLPCHFCKKAFSTPQQYNRHLRNVHRGEARVEIFNVDETSMTRTGSKSNDATTPNSMLTDEQICRACKKVCPNAKSLKFHIAALHKTSYRWFKCDNCGMRAATKSILEHHVQTKSCLEEAKK